MQPPRILDPRMVPVVGTDAHLPALDADRLNADALRRRFAWRAAGFEPEFGGDARLALEHPATPASVLVPLVLRPQGLSVLLTRRTDHLRDHAGQISFPGGRAEPQDRDAAATALREAQEEVGLPPDAADVLGLLPAYTTITHYVVTPVVALVRPLDLHTLALDRFEVAEAFEVPLHFLMTPAHHRRHVFSDGAVQRPFLSMPWHGPGADGQTREYFIWGATAAMLRNLYRFLAT